MAFLKSLLNRWLARPSDLPVPAQDRYRQLQQMQRRHTFLSVRFPRIERSYQSLILALHPDEGFLLIDELFPSTGRETLLEGDVVEVGARGAEGAVSFLSRLLQRELVDGTPAYRLELPEEIGASYRRGAFRVYVEREQDLHIDLRDGDGNPCSAHVVNLSIEGIKLSITSAGAALERQRQHQALLRLPGDDTIECLIEFSHIYSMRTPAPRTLAGGSLHVTSAAQRNRLGQYLAGVQRRQRRREARTG
jgi:c-di-GMP-binding flagellar brake protein YcgR